MTSLQKLILDAFDQLGAMTRHELETACLIGPKQRGGFSSTIVSLFERGWIRSDDYQIQIAPDGVHAVEAQNLKEIRIDTR